MKFKFSRHEGHVCTPRFMAALFAMTQRWKQFEGPSADKWINKMRYMHPMKYYSVFKRKEILIPDKTQMSLENIMVSEESQIYEDKYYMIALT